MKKILFAAPSFGVGGMERVLATLANRLVKTEYDVTILLLSPVDSMKSELDSRVRVIYKPPKSHLGSRIPYVRHKIYDDGMWETRASARQLYEYYVGDEHYDVEIAFFRGMCVKIISGSTNRDAVRLAWVHNDFRLAKGWQNNFRTITDVREAYSRFDKVICVSEQAKEGFAAAVGDTGNLIRIYNMLPVSDIRRKAAEEPPIPMPEAKLNAVIAARLLDRAKGQLRLVDTVARLRDEGADISLTVVGGGEDEELIKDRVREKNAGSYIVLTGEQSNPYPYISKADLLICASYYEGYNLTVAEAIILGTPVLSTDCTGPREILDGGRYGMLVDNSEQGLYEGLRQLADSPALLRSYKDKTAERQDFFDEDAVLHSITELF